jgi:hypothetical protein
MENHLDAERQVLFTQKERSDKAGNVLLGVKRYTGVLGCDGKPETRLRSPARNDGIAGAVDSDAHRIKPGPEVRNCCRSICLD